MKLAAAAALIVLFVSVCAPPHLGAQTGGAPTRQPSNPQQPEPLPKEPLNASETAELPSAQEELPLFPSELLLRPVPEDKPTELPRYKLQLAIDAVQPVLPPLEHEFGGVALSGTVKVFVKKFQFEGNHVFSDRQLGQVVAAYLNRTITSEELEEARLSLTKRYIDAGYISSGALLPDQDVANGVIRFRIVEGHLSRVQLQGNFWFRSWWLRNQLRRAAGNPVNVNNLKVGLQLLRQNPAISQINAELKPDSKQGESVLHVAVRDEQPFRLGLEISNQRPPSVGEGLAELFLSDLNLTGHNDPLDLRWGLIRWTKDGAIEYAEFDNISGSYEFPITPWDTTAAIRASRSDSSIIDETFAELGITSRSEQFALTMRQPIYQTLTNTFAVSASADRKHSETLLLGRPFSLSAGAINGESDVFATRFVAEWLNRSQRHVLALRSTFSFGFYAFGSTGAESAGADGPAGAPSGFDSEIPDSKFFTWLGQLQYLRRIFDIAPFQKKPESAFWNHMRETLLVLRANAQFSDEPLLALEQFSIGGMQSVRGYRENQLLRDNGLFLSAELRIPLWLKSDKTTVLSLAPFFDFGEGWNSSQVEDNNQAIYSAGVGLIVNATRHCMATVYWGHGFVDLHESKDSFQDYGLHFAVSFNAF